MAAADDIPRSWSLASVGGLIAIVIGPPWLIVAAGGASWITIAAGAAIWAASVAAKRSIAAAVQHWCPAAWRPPMRFAAVQGGVSALTELIPAGAYFLAVPLTSFADVLAFGIGAGSAEAAYVLALGILHPQQDEDVLRLWIAGAKASWCVRLAVPIERLFALVGHVGARGLLYVALMQDDPRGPAWGIIAVALFAAIDGVAIYGHMRQWPWHEPAICRRAHAFFAALSVAEFGLLLATFRA